MGDTSMPVAPKINGLIDYAHSDLKEDWLDLYISSRCKFFIGTGSGATAMSFFFGIPIVSVNIAPLSHVPLISPGDISIPKLYLNFNNELMGFKEVFSTDSANYRYNNLFVDKKIDVIYNTSEEIKDVVKEMYLRVSSKWINEIDDDELQEKFISLLKDGHYSFKSSARIGSSFLRKYKELLEK